MTEFVYRAVQDIFTNKSNRNVGLQQIYFSLIISQIAVNIILLILRHIYKQKKIRQLQ